MKIELTKTEATAIIIDYFRKRNAEFSVPDPDNCEIVIVEDNLIPKEILNVINAIDKMDYQHSEKIRAIKELRSNTNYNTNYSLPCGKWIIEHWAEFKEWVMKHKKLPELESDGGPLGSFQFPE